MGRGKKGRKIFPNIKIYRKVNVFNSLLNGSTIKDICQIVEYIGIKTDEKQKTNRHLLRQRSYRVETNTLWTQPRWRRCRGRPTERDGRFGVTCLPGPEVHDSPGPGSIVPHGRSYHVLKSPSQGVTLHPSLPLPSSRLTVLTTPGPHPPLGPRL